MRQVAHCFRDIESNVGDGVSRQCDKMPDKRIVYYVITALVLHLVD